MSAKEDPAASPSLLLSLALPNSPAPTISCRSSSSAPAPPMHDYDDDEEELSLALTLAPPTPRSRRRSLPLEDDDLLREILVRLPPQPSSLPRASLVSRRWLQLVSDPRFSRRFRLRHGRSSPILGLFTKNQRQREIACVLTQGTPLPNLGPLHPLWGQVVVSTPPPPTEDAVPGAGFLRNRLPAVLLGDCLYLLLIYHLGILEFDLGRDTLNVIAAPVDMCSETINDIMVMPAAEGAGWLGFLVVTDIGTAQEEHDRQCFIMGARNKH